MKYLDNNIVSIYYTEAVVTSITKFCLLIKDYPFIIKPFRGVNEKARDIFSKEHFLLYSTVKRTTLFYDRMIDCFFKILHPLTLKHKIVFHLKNKAKSIYNLSEYLLSRDMKVPRVIAYGFFKKGKVPFFVMKMIEGKSLYDILIRKQNSIPWDMYLEVADEVARFHRLGYWFGDAHLSHIFVNDSGVSGFIDIDTMKNNKPFRLKNLAKDLAGLNHPELPITEEDKIKLINYYMNKLKIKREKDFLKLIKYYSERRWKE